MRESDKRMRELERRARAGDRDAANQLIVDQARSGYSGTEYEELAEFLGLKEPTKFTVKSKVRKPVEHIDKFISLLIADLALEKPELNIANNLLPIVVYLLKHYGLPDQIEKIVQTTRYTDPYDDYRSTIIRKLRDQTDYELEISPSYDNTSPLIYFTAELRKPADIKINRLRAIINWTIKDLIKVVGLEKAREILVKHLLPQLND